MGGQEPRCFQGSALALKNKGLLPDPPRPRISALAGEPTGLAGYYVLVTDCHVSDSLKEPFVSAAQLRSPRIKGQRGAFSSSLVHFLPGPGILPVPVCHHWFVITPGQGGWFRIGRG